MRPLIAIVALISGALETHQLALASNAATNARDLTDEQKAFISEQPKAPSAGICIGYPDDVSILPRDVKEALDEVNRKIP